MRKSPKPPKHIQPVPDNKPIELANTPAAWRKVDERIERAVNLICQDDDQETIDALLLLTDLVGNPSFEASFRKGVLATIQAYTYRHTYECQDALEAYLDKLNPDRKRRVS